MAFPTAAQIRARVPVLASEADFPAADLDELVAEFADTASAYRGVSYVPVTGETERVWLDGERVVRLSRALITSVTSVVVTWLGTAQTVPLSAIQIQQPRDLDLGAAYTGEAVIVYGHGHTSTPGGMARACREFVRASALRARSNVGRDVLSQAGDAGGTTRYVTPDWDAGRPTGFVTVDGILNAFPDYRTQGIG